MLWALRMDHYHYIVLPEVIDNMIVIMLVSQKNPMQILNFFEANWICKASEVNVKQCM